MTRSIRPKPDQGPPEKKPIEIWQAPSLGKQAGMLFATILFMICFCFWSLNDVTGEYAYQDRDTGLVRLSLVRKATNVKGELAYGQGALMEMTTPSVPQGKTLVWIFRTPDRWVQNGQRRRTVKFVGLINDNVVKGTMQEGNMFVPVVMTRNNIASISKMFQSHLPWWSE